MWSIVVALLGSLRSALRARRNLVLENLALRQQLALLRQRSKRPRFGRFDQLFWVHLFGAGCAGAMFCTWYGPKPLSAGIARGSAPSGLGSRSVEVQDARRWTRS